MKRAIYTRLCLLLFVSTVYAQDATLAASTTATDKGRHEEQATLFPIPDYSGDLFSRSALSGDWGGARTAMANNGMQFTIGINQYYQGIMSGGLDERWEYNGSTDYRLRFDSAKASLWPGGFLEAHGETYWGDSVNSFTGALLPVNMDASLNLPAGNGTYLSHVVLTQFLSERFAVTMGKIDTSTGDTNAFAHGVGDRGFMNAGFLLNPVTYLTSPYSTLGGGFFYLFGAKKQHQFIAMAYDGDGQIDRTGFDTLFDGEPRIPA